MKYGWVALFLVTAAWSMSTGAVRSWLSHFTDVYRPRPRAPQLARRYRLVIATGLATVDELAAMADPERQRLLSAARLRERAARAAGRTVDVASVATASCDPARLYCPACGSTLGDGRAPVGFVSGCVACGSQLRSRAVGARVIVEVVGEG